MISGLITILIYALQLYSLALIVYVLMSWLPGAYQSWLGRELGKICIPYLRLFSFIPPLGMLDFSPIVAFFVLRLIIRFLAGLTLVL
ncbi:YggT family protein [Eupransor demetentiae]|uniref:YggT family (Ycf19) n=1 Tax=Eupransor demetentiae TaxID=3109584 RepID=A0ABP0ESJ6_9LACO|nr:Cytochrome b6 maturation protein CCB3/Ycf19 and related maturases [Lactobacillaceae bacterium LMG 33000]